MEIYFENIVLPKLLYNDRLLQLHQLFDSVKKEMGWRTIFCPSNTRKKNVSDSNNFSVSLYA